MGRRNKIDKETKLRIVHEYRNGQTSITKAARELGISENSIRQWMMNYESIGNKTFDEKPRNRAYTEEFKIAVISAYELGEGSYESLAKKYGISSVSVVRNWVSKYNRHDEIKAYDPKGHVYMAKTRKVSYEEKIEIVKWAIEHNHEYKLAAEKFMTSYAQVYNWVKKYKTEGELGLQDDRGKRTPVKNLSEIEKLKRENELLRRRNERLEMEAEVIKKFQEIERRDIIGKSVKKQNTRR